MPKRPTSDDADANRRAMAARNGSPFLSTKEAAFYIGLKPHSLTNMRVRGEGPRYRRHGRHIFYHIDDLDAWSLARGS